MMLFERVKCVASQVAGSVSKLAAVLDIPQPTFQGYLKEARQDNLWPILPRILAAFPEVSRDWLYFEEGTMLVQDADHDAPEHGSETDGSEGNGRIAELSRENARLEAELSELKGKHMEVMQELIESQRENMLLMREREAVMGARTGKDDGADLLGKRAERTSGVGIYPVGR